MKLLNILLLSLLAFTADAAVTYTPGPWKLYRSGSIVLPWHTSAAACDAALHALPVTSGTVTLKCQQSVTAKYTATPPPPPTPVDCVVSAWSAWQGDSWSVCSVSGMQTRLETRTRSVLTPPANGGTACPALVEQRTASQACTPSPPSAEILFTDSFESGDILSWSSSSIGGVTVGNVDAAADGSRYLSALLAQGNGNDYGLYANLTGSVSARPSQFVAQYYISFDSFTGGWPLKGQKSAIFQLYDSTWNGGALSNANRKFQILMTVSNAGQACPEGDWMVQIFEWNNTTDGSFRDGTNICQGGTSYGPADSFGRWDALRLEVRLDTNGAAGIGQLGVGFGDGLISLTRNGQVIIYQSDVNIVRGNPNVALGRLLLSSSSLSASWIGSSSREYWDGYQVATAVEALAAMPTASKPRVGAPPPPPPPPGGSNNNPDALPETAQVLYGRDYETMDASEVISQPGLVTMQWGAFGYGGSNGWRAYPQPITGGGSNEDSAGWAPIETGPFSGNHPLVTASFYMRMSGALANCIDACGSFWSHVNKVFDFKYKAAGGGEGNRNGFHFGENPPQFRFSSGGAGGYPGMGPDWRTLADQWVWVALVVDMRGASASQRYLAAYIKPIGAANVMRIGKRFENDTSGGFALQAYNGNGLWGLFSPLFGYWDDMNGRENLGTLSNYYLDIDHVRFTPGWPVGAEGPLH